MLRASSLGLSFAFKSIRRVPHTWNVAYRSKPHPERQISLPVHPLLGDKHSPSSPHTYHASSSPREETPSSEEREKSGFRKLNILPKYALSLRSGKGRNTDTEVPQLTPFEKRLILKRSRRQRFWRYRANRRYYYLPSSSNPIADQLPVEDDLTQEVVFRRQTGQVAALGSAKTHINVEGLDEMCSSQGLPRISATLIRLVHTMGKKHHLQDAWSAFAKFEELKATHPILKNHPCSIPPPVLSRLAHFIAQSRPVTKSHFRGLLKVLKAYWDAGEDIPPALWNTLIAFAGKGHRAPKRRDYKKALSIFHDMVGGRRPGSGLDKNYDGHVYNRQPTKPDIYTFTALIDVASKSLSQEALHDALSLFSSSGLKPNRITHLCMMYYHTRKKQLEGIRGTVLAMRKQKLELGIDGLNACIYAYSFNDRHDLVRDIYRVMRNNISKDPDPKAIALIMSRLAGEEHLVIPPSLRPDIATYTTVIQSMAHLGDFSTAFSTFSDMITYKTHGRIEPVTIHAFRAVFLGFSKHGVPGSSGGGWNLTNLQKTYKIFMRVPLSKLPTRSTIYWIMDAFDKTSGGDKTLLRQTWFELENRFARLEPLLFTQPRLQRMKARLVRETEDYG